MAYVNIRKKLTVILCAMLLLVPGACGAGEEGGYDMDDGGISKVTDGKEGAKEKAHVILLAGQSNASGISHVRFLKKHVSTDKFEAYTKGYDNIRICYYVDSQNISSEFVPVALGQGYTADHFGPEVGIAEYLTANYPAEKFYIIKVTASGSGIAAEWQETDETYNRMITGIQNGFQRLTSAGLDPEWFATCWMQGEGDSVSIVNAENYYNLESDLMNRLKERFGGYASPKGISLIDAGISDFEEWAYQEKVNAAKKKYASENEMNFYLDTQGAGLTYDQDNEDHAHYDAVSMLELGRLFGEKVKEAALIQGYCK